MEEFTAIIEVQTSLLRELRETYVALCKCYSSGESAAAKAAILRSIEKLALTTLPAAPSVIPTQQIEPPAAEICKVTHDVVRICNERNGRPGWENYAAEFCGISPKRAIEVWDAAVAEAKVVLFSDASDTATATANRCADDIIAEAYAKPYFAEAKTTKPKTAKPELAIGQTWRNRLGGVGVIERKTGGRFFCRFGTDLVRSYDAEGNYGPIKSKLDLMELVSDGD